MSPNEPDSFAIEWQRIKFRISSLLVEPSGGMRKSPLTAEELNELKNAKKQAAILLKRLLVCSLERELAKVNSSEPDENEAWNAFIATSTKNADFWSEIPEYVISTNY